MGDAGVIAAAAPTQVDEYQPEMLEIFTTSPVCGEWMN